MKTWSTAKRAEADRAIPCALCGGLAMKGLWSLDGFSFARCASCGLIQQNPQPLEGAVLARYGDAYLEYERENEARYLDLALKALADVRFPLERGKGSSFLDVGCATGALLERMREEGWRVAGIEVDRAMAAHCARERGLDVHAGTLADAPWGDGSFDAAHASHVIEHVNDPESFLLRLRELLRPGGLLALTTPNAAGFQARIFGSGWRSAINDHLYLFTPGTLRRLLSRAGFRVIRMRTWGGWALGARPAWLKPILDPLAKALGQGDVMALLAERS